MLIQTNCLFRQLYCFGISSVIKGLERDELRLVLIWKATQPPELKKAVLSLVIRTGCPAASISDVLHPVKASYESLSSLTAMGVKVIVLQLKIVDKPPWFLLSFTKETILW